jgi:hypothetical protein
VLAAAYVLYRLYLAEGDALPSLDFSRFKLGELGRSLPYLVAPLIAVLTEFYRRRRARAVRKEWETRERMEGFVRGEEDIEVRIVKGGRGAFRADLRLTRAALYLFDKSGRREPVRLALSSPGLAEAAVEDAQLIGDAGGGRPRVRISTTGTKGMTFEFESAGAEAWWVDLRRSLGKPTRRDADGGPAVADARTTSAAGDRAGSHTQEEY